MARLILAAVECAEPVSETRHEVVPVELSTGVARSLPRIEDLGAVAVDPGVIPMAEAEFILSGGNGVKDWGLFHHAASALGATEGASRVAVDDGFMGRERQVGASGTWVTARVYVAVGISGAIQHLQGIGACDKVIAINLDAGCDMVKRADLSVIGESAEVLTALIAAVQAWRSGGKRDAA
ncbi:Electron transfer flavoprotein [Pseudomonas savastanoi pv. phaseolicola]|nr:Electron transfer flavoprotein [Pseudomonas savastanoi pv. phaseolicola]